MGRLPPASSIAGTVPLMTSVATARGVGTPAAGVATASSGTAARMAVTAALPPDTPVSVLWHGAAAAATGSTEAIVVSVNLPPVPGKLAEKIWRKEFIELDALLPSRLGAAEPTLQDLVCGERKKEKKGIATIQEWVGCFNSFMAVVLVKEPSRAKDLLAYSSLIVKASSEYEKEAWLGYDRLFRRQAAAEPA